MPLVLWIAPNLNHYKAGQLNRLVETTSLKITVLSGKQMKELGHQPYKQKENFRRINFNSNKTNFHFQPSTYHIIFRLISKIKFDVVLMPFEKKFIVLIILLYILKFPFNYKLISYNHPISISKTINLFNLDNYLSKLFYALYDRIVLYNETAKDKVVERKLISRDKAYFANNTLDTTKIWKHYSFSINNSDDKTILFIGRLIQNKKLNILINYYQYLKREWPQLKLIVIGDGPEADKIKTASQKDSSIIWYGAITDEGKIAEHMNRAHVVLNPGHSGLSIVHAFCYGKPYITLSSYKNHPPEIDYLQHGINGLLLSGQINEDCTQIGNLLLNKESYASMCKAAFETAQKLSIDKWCSQMQNALTV